MTAKLQEKMQKPFYCEKCDFSSSNKYNFDKHLLTSKHKNTTFMVTNTTILQKNAIPTTYHTCECGKKYCHRGSLFNHKKKCQYGVINDKDMKKKDKELVMKLVEENTEIKNILFKQFESIQTNMYEQQKEMNKQINELIPKVGNNNIVNKNKVNINIFLNEQCKDAITMEEFIKKIEVSLGNLLLTKEKGLSEGVSNIFIENMNKLSLYERPLHCTDAKREILYIKSEDSESKWERDDDNLKLKTALKQVSCMQQQSLNKWIEEHPNWENNLDEQEEYMQLVKNCTEDISNKEYKVIKRLCNETLLNV
tara:strand:+ start:7673 stop:8599 length:927 start_codon:yes stop_codon:yes gene_type:complete